MRLLLYLAAFLLVVTAFAHTLLGERYILRRLFRREDLPKLFGSVDFTIRTLRFAWHITSVAWVGFAGIVLLLAHPPITSSGVGLVVGSAFLIQFVIACVGSRGRHLSWIVFLIVGALTILATRG